jgi:hypothetical protein
MFVQIFVGAILVIIGALVFAGLAIMFTVRFVFAHGPLGHRGAPAR